MTIAEIGEAERLSPAYVAKLLRILRLNGFVESVRGQEGGYTLNRAPAAIMLSDVLASLGGRFYKPGFCDHFAGTDETCTHTFSCSIRPLWRRVQSAIDSVLETTTLAELMTYEPTVPPAAARIPNDRVTVPTREIPTRELPAREVPSS